MKIIADLQLHSKYSRATSQKMDIAYIFEWAKIKGIGLIATGDWTHPLWVREIKANLEETGNGLLTFKNKKKHSPLFLLSTEISSIYTQGGKARRIHNLIWASSIKTVDKINAELTKRGCNITSDGRPIVGLTSQQIAKLVLEIDENCLIIPAHVWTPWFSLYGSKSGFDTIEECFGKFSKYIYAIETGLSSDPTMNWRIRDLDNRAILSFSDAHSGPKLGREATVFDLEELSYKAIKEAISLPKPGLGKLKGQALDRLNRIACTFEFYPEEGKYHYTGHRNCNVRQNPKQTNKRGKVCHVCGRPLTVGVMHRVEDLSNREIQSIEKFDDNGIRWIYHPKNKKPPFVNLVPLLEILSEVIGTSSHSQKVLSEYKRLTEEIGSEFHILLKSDIEEIRKIGGEKLAQAIKKVRAGDIFVDPGYDGVFGKVKIFKEGEKEKKSSVKKTKDQMSLF